MAAYQQTVAVVIPCLDEKATIGRAVDDFRAQLPDAFLRWKLTSYGKLEPDQTRVSIRSFGARYLFSRREKNWQALLTQLSRAPWAEPVFADDFAVVYAIH